MSYSRSEDETTNLEGHSAIRSQKMKQLIYKATRLFEAWRWND